MSSLTMSLNIVSQHLHQSYALLVLQLGCKSMRVGTAKQFGGKCLLPVGMESQTMQLRKDLVPYYRYSLNWLLFIYKFAILV
jgi:hypothetical protein